MTYTVPPGEVNPGQANPGLGATFPLTSSELQAAREYMGKDHWVHRQQGMCCRTCMWFVPKEGGLVPEGGPLGRCRRHAPTLGGWPAVWAADWCGDHKLDEAKL